MIVVDVLQSPARQALTRACALWRDTELEGCVSAWRWQETDSEGCVSAWRWQED